MIISKDEATIILECINYAHRTGVADSRDYTVAKKILTHFPELEVTYSHLREEQ